MPLCRHPDATPYSLLHIIDQRALDSVVTLECHVECQEDETAKGFIQAMPLYWHVPFNHAAPEHLKTSTLKLLKLKEFHRP